jgi:hypothetical protein
MTLSEFQQSIESGEPPADLSAALRGLWQDARGDWDTAHRIVQHDDGRDAAWVHAYLHRKEGDKWNAAYWYTRAERPVRVGRLDDEWREIAGALLSN